MIEWWRNRRRAAQLRQRRQEVTLRMNADVRAAVRHEIETLEDATGRLRALFEQQQEESDARPAR